MFTVQDLYEGLKQATMTKPELETWRVIEYMRGGEMFSSNLGATILDKGKPYFWSKAWADSGYTAQVDWRFPLLATFEVNATVSQQAKRLVDFNLELYLLDKYDEADERSINEIFESTESLLFDALQYLAGCTIYRVDDERDLLLHKDRAQAMIEQGAIMSAVATTPKLLSDQITVQSMFRVTYPADNVFGTGFLLNFKSRQGCLNPEFDHSAYIDDACYWNL